MDIDATNSPPPAWRECSHTAANRLIAAAERDGVRVVFRVPQEAQGQIVEHAFAGLGEAGILERVIDRSDGSIAYNTRDWRDDDPDPEYFGTCRPD